MSSGHRADKPGIACARCRGSWTALPPGNVPALHVADVRADGVLATVAVDLPVMDHIHARRRIPAGVRLAEEGNAVDVGFDAELEAGRLGGFEQLKQLVVEARDLVAVEDVSPFVQRPVTVLRLDLSLE